MSEKTVLSYADLIAIVDLVETFYLQGIDDAPNGGAHAEIRREILNQVYAKFDDDLPF